jgi:hypothetical protein
MTDAALAQRLAACRLHRPRQCARSSRVDVVDACTRLYASIRCRNKNTMRTVCRVDTREGGESFTRSPLRGWHSCSSSSCHHRRRRTWTMLAGRTGERRSECSTLKGPTQSQLGMASRTHHLPGDGDQRVTLRYWYAKGGKPRSRTLNARRPVRPMEERDTYALLELLVDGV